MDEDWAAAICRESSAKQKHHLQDQVGRVRKQIITDGYKPFSPLTFIGPANDPNFLNARKEYLADAKQAKCQKVYVESQCRVMRHPEWRIDNQNIRPTKEQEEQLAQECLGMSLVMLTQTNQLHEERSEQTKRGLALNKMDKHREFVQRQRELGKSWQWIANEISIFDNDPISKTSIKNWFSEK